MNNLEEHLKSYSSTAINLSAKSKSKHKNYSKIHYNQKVIIECLQDEKKYKHSNVIEAINSLTGCPYDANKIKLIIDTKNKIKSFENATTFSKSHNITEDQPKASTECKVQENADE